MFAFRWILLIFSVSAFAFCVGDKPPEVKPFEDLVAELKADFDRRFALEGEPVSIEWAGPPMPAFLSHAVLPCQTALGQEGLVDYSKRQGISSFETLEGIFLRIAMEEGRRLFLKSGAFTILNQSVDSVLSQIRAQNIAAADLALGLLPTSWLLNMGHFFRSRRLQDLSDPHKVELNHPLTHWPVSGMPFSLDQLFGLYAKTLLTGYKLETKRSGIPAMILREHFELLMAKGVDQGLAHLFHRDTRFLQIRNDLDLLSGNKRLAVLERMKSQIDDLLETTK